jgi:hypothetical protein
MAEHAFLRGAMAFLLAVTCAPCARAETPRRPTPAPSGSATLAPAPQPAPPSPFGTSNAGSTDEGARSRARTLYDQGAQAYNDSRYSQAAEYFLDAHRAYPMPQLLFNVAKSYDKLGAQSSALAYYRDYLRQLANAPDASDVGIRVRELEAILAQRGVQQLSIITEPARALVAIDSTPVGVTPFTGDTWPGDHRLTLTLDGHKELTNIITVKATQAQDFLFTLERSPAPSTEQQGATKAKSKERAHVSAVTWLVLGTGTAALGTTLIVEMAQKNTTGLTRTGAFFGGVGLTASLLGGLLLHLDLYEPDATPTQKRRAFAASLSGRF